MGREIYGRAGVKVHVDRLTGAYKRMMAVALPRSLDATPQAVTNSCRTRRPR